MYNEGTPDFTVDQGMYYPTATNYGYYCTGYESPAEWEDHHRIFGADGQDIQYAGVQTEGLPYVYYIPNYGYAQSQHNPYNPHIPGAVVGIDGPYFGTQQYYPLSPYQEPMSSPAYAPVIVQPDFASNTSLEPLMDTHVPFSHGTEGNSKSGFASSSAFFPRNPPKPAPSQSKLLNRMFDGSRANIGPNKHSVSQRDSSSGSYLTPTMTHGLQSRGASGSRQTVDNISNRNVLSQSKQLHIATPVSDVYSKFGSSAHRVDKNQTKYLASRPQSSVIASVDSLGEKNRGPRTNNSKIQLPGKAYVAKTGKNNAQGDTVIRTDQYNKDDFPVDYVFAKFFVIKSYSEDDVHKSIKYNVWSSTPNGNRKLQSAYEESQEISSEKHGACPVFLFFSVNASGQFCGVAEMIGPVDFHKDMGFWQQDKWSGSFPVKWHILKDVPNNNFRHIILENNENKPVTNSRDTQEIMYKQGLEMLMIFKNHPLTTSVLNDFMYYENRQKIMQEEKARKNNYIKSVHTPFLLPAVGATILGQHVQQPSTSVANGVEQKDSDNLKKSDLGQHVERRPLKLENHMERTPIKILKKSDKSDFRLVSSTSHSNNSNTERVTSDETRAEGEGGITSALKIGLLDINPRPAESASSPNVTAPVFISEDVNIVNVGSMPIKLNGFTEPTKPHTISSIPLDLRELQLGKSGTSPT